MLFPKGTFEVGSKEKHKIFFKIDHWWGIFDVFVDDNPTVINGKSIMGGPFTIEIGSEEKNNVTFQIIIPAIFALFRDKQVQVLVDGKLFKTF